MMRIYFKLIRPSAAVLLFASLAYPLAGLSDESKADRKPAVLGPATDAPLPGENGVMYLDQTDEAPDSLPATEGPGNSESETPSS